MELERVELGLGPAPQAVLRALRGDRAPFLLTGGWAGGGAVAGSDPVRACAPGEDPFALLDLPPLEGPEGAVGGGWIGHLGFGLGAAVERLPPAPPRPVPGPFAGLAFYDHVLRLDAAGRWWFEALVTEARRPALAARLAELRARLAAAPSAGRPWRLRGMSPRAPGHDGHRWAVADVVRRIAEGELFQANVCLRLEGELDGEALDAFADASAALEPALGAFVTTDGGALMSFSPELFLRRSGREAWTAPIKGTAPRLGGGAEAARARLAASAKDAAEHVMIVDLMRNDLGRVAEFGSVDAAPAPDVEAHPGVWHLVSRVRARLRGEAGDGDLLRATFPPGSVTGAPKVQALKVISAVEATAREAYTGAIGLASPVAGLHLSVAIRTFEVRGRHVWLGCGGGVVADSDPDAELREALGKARPLVEALGGSVPEPGPWRRRPVPRLLEGPRPDPARGVLETLRVSDGRPQHLERHLRRLAAAAGGLPADLEARVHAAATAAGPGVHRLRISFLPGPRVVVETAPAGEPPGPVALEPVCLPGGLGAHKWADRRLVSGWPPGTAPLLVDADGAVLEAGWANVWIVEDGRLLTPPADGRLLPGVTRERVLERPEAEEAEIDLDRLQRAGAVLLTSSVALVTPGGPGAAAAEAAAALRAGLLSAGSGPWASAPPRAGRGRSPAPGR